ncbi:hypothetical protein D4Z93_05415 [Clostridium fermenticellae]|uniref:TerB family tellurite resistance protein n=1 Tax=Clostridium fermenticellae TaxID=2068654 RepID=A0A386H2Q3_9CLOT|nr:hypothetical protein [Clostridium fermenticellae]AYD39982.1 hypothetical protein D4Z93_05415 [Clostridium fermenticellae]
MFLNELNKKESIAFVNLVELLAKSDNLFAKKEKNLICDYIEELSLNKDEIPHMSFDKIIEQLKDSTSRIKNIIYLELIGLALIDGSFDEEEIKFLNAIAGQFKFTREDQQKFIDFFKILKDKYDSTFLDADSKINSLKELAESIL